MVAGQTAVVAEARQPGVDRPADGLRVRGRAHAQGGLLQAAHEGDDVVHADAATPVDGHERLGVDGDVPVIAAGHGPRELLDVRS